MPESAPPPKTESFWEFVPCAYRNTVDGRYYDYVLVLGNVDPFAGYPPGPHFEAVMRDGDWTLFAKLPGLETALGEGTTDDGPCARSRLGDERR